MTTGLKGSIPRGGTVQALALLALAFLVQAAYLAESRDEPTFGRPVVDAATYDGMAREIAAGTFSLNTPYYQPPLFPYFLALLYRASGNSMLAAKIALALIGALTVMFTALTARRLGGPGPAWAAGLMAAGCGPLIFFNAQLLPAGLAAMLNILFLWLLLGAGAPGAPARCLAAGAAAGLAAITVPNILLFVPFALAWIFRAGVGRGRAARQQLL